MRKWTLLVLTVLACSRGPAPGTSLTGALTARDAAMAFLNGAKAQDLQAMSAVWGTEKGSVREQLDPKEMEQRLLILQPCYAYDRMQVLDEGDGPEGRRIIRVQLTKGNLTKTAAMKLVRGPEKRWYMEDADYSTVRELCAK